MDFFEKLDKNPYEDLKWNIPERKQGSMNVIGGCSGNFRTEVKVAEYMAANYPVQDVWLVLPDALKGKLPVLPNFKFLPSSESGSFNESQELVDVFNVADFNLVIGDLSRNSVTGRGLSSAVKSSEKMTLITRDSVDLLVENQPDRWLMNENLIIFASVAQLQKLLRAVYYPKMLLMSQSLVQVVEVLHKFTLSYPVCVVTLHNEQILVAGNGLIKAVPLAKSGYSPLMLWSGEMAAKIAGMNLYNPSRVVDATACAVFQ
ncbi:hypothetical protein IKD98_00535 [Candidatus Saccharibacteria bacterium]|nr:hypothetical protein [Candidatus Saccharibacteria bacterium]